MENGYPHFAVLTREPGESIRFIHNRMPVILRADQINDWINPEAKPEEIIQEAITEMEFVPVD